jgi:Tfp pilus assembly protein PilF
MTAPTTTSTASSTRGAGRRRIGLLAVAAALSVVLLENLGTNFLYDLLLRLPGIDKAMHWVQYLAVFFVCWWGAGALRVRPVTRAAIAVAGGLLIGVVDETVQGQFAKRSAEWADLAVDAVAVIAGAALVLSTRRVVTAAVVTASLFVTGVLAYRTHEELVHVNQALLYERAHDLRGARREYRLAVEQGHATPGVLNALAWAELESGEGSAADAVRFAERARAARPDDPDVLDTYGWALHHVGRSREALPILERARARNPDIYCVDYHLGVVLRALDRQCEARKRFEQQVARFPRTTEAARAARELADLGCAAGN